MRAGGCEGIGPAKILLRDFDRPVARSFPVMSRPFEVEMMLTHPHRPLRRWNGPRRRRGTIATRCRPGARHGRFVRHGRSWRL